MKVITRYSSEYVNSLYSRFLLRHRCEKVDFIFWLVRNIFKHKLRIQKLWIEFIRGDITLTDYKYLSRLTTRRLRFGGVDFIKKLLENPKQSVVVLRPKHFGDEPATFPEELRG